MPRSAIRLRNLTLADIPFAMRLKHLAGWNQTEADWRRFLELEPLGCFVADYEARPAGTVATLGYGSRFGWIGMMLVDPERRRLGIASALLQRSIGYLAGQNVETARLDATPDGKRVYDQNGFKAEYRVERCLRSAAPLATQASSCGPILSRELDGIAEFDTRIFGADRRRLLATLLRDTPELCFQTDGGYVMGRRGAIATQVGPLVAMDVAVAERLLVCALHVIGQAPSLLDVPMCNEAAAALSVRYGFQKQRELIRQFRGPNRFPGNPQKVFGVAGPELG